MQSIRVLQRYRINWVHAYVQRAIYFKELLHAIGGGACKSKICRVGWYRLEIQVWFDVSVLGPKSTEQTFVCWSLFLPLLVVSMLLASRASNLWYMRQKENRQKKQVSLPGPEGPSQSAFLFVLYVMSRVFSLTSEEE